MPDTAQQTGDLEFLLSKTDTQLYILPINDLAAWLGAIGLKSTTNTEYFVKYSLEAASTETRKCK